MLNENEVPLLKPTLAQPMPGEIHAGCSNHRWEIAGCETGCPARAVPADHGRGARADSFVTLAAGTIWLHQRGRGIRVPRRLLGRLRVWKNLPARGLGGDGQASMDSRQTDLLRASGTGRAFRIVRLGVG